MAALNLCLELNAPEREEFKFCDIALQMVILQREEGNGERREVVNADKIMILGREDAIQQRWGLLMDSISDIEGKPKTSWEQKREKWLEELNKIKVDRDTREKNASKAAEVFKAAERACSDDDAPPTYTQINLSGLPSFIYYTHRKEKKQRPNRKRYTNVFLIRVTLFDVTPAFPLDGFHSVMIAVFAPKADTDTKQRVAFLMNPNGYDARERWAFCKLYAEFEKAGIRLFWSRGLQLNHNWYHGGCHIEIYTFAASFVLYMNNRIRALCINRSWNYDDITIDESSKCDNFRAAAANIRNPPICDIQTTGKPYATDPLTVFQTFILLAGELSQPRFSALETAMLAARCNTEELGRSAEFLMRGVLMVLKGTRITLCEGAGHFKDQPRLWETLLNDLRKGQHVKFLRAFMRGESDEYVRLVICPFGAVADTIVPELVTHAVRVPPSVALIAAPISGLLMPPYTWDEASFEWLKHLSRNYHTKLAAGSVAGNPGNRDKGLRCQVRGERVTTKFLTPTEENEEREGDRLSSLKRKISQSISQKWQRPRWWQTA